MAPRADLSPTGAGDEGIGKILSVRSGSLTQAANRSPQNVLRRSLWGV